MGETAGHDGDGGFRWWGIVARSPVLTPLCALLLLVLFWTAVQALFPAESREDDRLALTGSSTVAPLVAELAREFEEDRYHRVRIEVQSGGSSRGIADALEGRADLGMASRALHDDEAAELEAHTIARDGIALIVNVENPLENLRREQVIGIYTGRIRDWSEVGSVGGPIAVVSKGSGRATLDVFLDHFDLEETDLDADVVIGENLEAIRTVAANRRAIGFVSIGVAETERARGTGIRTVALDGIPATRKHLEYGRYPLYRPLNLVCRGGPKPLAADFIAFARSEEGREVVRRLNFVPLAE